MLADSAYWSSIVVPFGPQQDAYVFRGTSGECTTFLVNNNRTQVARVVFQNTAYALPRRSISILPDCKTVAFNTGKIGLLGERLQIYRDDGQNKVQWNGFGSSVHRSLTWYKESSMDLSSARTSSQSLHICVIAPGSSPNTNNTAPVPEMTPTSKNSTIIAPEVDNDADGENNLVDVEVGEWMNWMMIVSLQQPNDT